MLYFKLSSILMLDITTNSAPQNIFFTSAYIIIISAQHLLVTTTLIILVSIIITLFPSLKAIVDYEERKLQRKFKHYYL